MARITFFEKPGCINNTKQKALLAASGHKVIARNLLAEPWTPQRLRPFFGSRPVTEWFNPSAPGIKSGEVAPTRLNEVQALDLMMTDPLLIRRPLLEMGERREVGFDSDLIRAWLGLGPERQDAAPATESPRDWETCPRSLKDVARHGLHPGFPQKCDDPHKPPRQPKGR